MGMFKASHRRVLNDVRNEIMAYFKVWAHRPVLIGQIALELKCSLQEAEDFLTGLVSEGVIYVMTEQEALQRGVIHGYRLKK